MADSSFDVVSKIDRQEVDNALNQAAKELATRFDFRGTDTTIAWKGEESIELVSSTEERLKAAVDVFKEKLVRRDISMKAFDAGEPQASGKTYKVTGTLKQGIDSEHAKKITKLIRDEGPKGVKTQIQGDEIRVSSKKRDDLQADHRAAEGLRPRCGAAVRQLPVTCCRQPPLIVGVTSTTPATKRGACDRDGPGDHRATTPRPSTSTSSSSAPVSPASERPTASTNATRD